MKRILFFFLVSLISLICYCGVKYGYKYFNAYNSKFIKYSVFASEEARADEKAEKKANEEEHPIDRWYSRCLDRARSQSEMGDCTVEAIKKWEKRLNYVYDKLMKKLPPKQRKLLNESYREWHNFRKKHMNLINEYAESLGGTLFYFAALSIEHNWIRNYTLDLEWMLQIENEK